MMLRPPTTIVSSQATAPKSETVTPPAPVVVVSDEVIARLESIGGKRWTQGSHDRIYLNIYENNENCAMREACGIFGTSGGYTDADGDKLSNNSVFKMATDRIFIDLTTGTVSAKSSYVRESLSAFIAG